MAVATTRLIETVGLFFVFAVPLTVAWTVAGAHIAVGGAMLVALILHFGRIWRLRRTPCDWAWVAWTAAMLLAVAFAVPEADSYVPLKKLALVPLIHVVAAALADKRRLVWGYRLFVLGISATVLVALVSHYASGDSLGRLRGSLHYMTFAGLILLSLPLVMGALLAERGAWRAVLLLSGLLLGWGLLLTSTRSAWLGIFAASAVMLARLRVRWLIALPLVAILAFFLAPERFQERALSAFDPNHAHNTDRILMWRAGFAMWREQPWTGVGLGDLQTLVARHADPGIQRVHGHLHNVWVQVLASTGIIGLAAFSFLMFRLAAMVLGTTSAPGELRYWGLGTWGAFIGFLFMGLFEWNFGDVEVTIALYFLLGLAASLLRLDHAHGNSIPARPVLQGGSDSNGDRHG